jgi:hypothetical protein
LSDVEAQILDVISSWGGRSGIDCVTDNVAVYQVWRTNDGRLCAAFERGTGKLARGMGAGAVAPVFPESTFSNDAYEFLAVPAIAEADRTPVQAEGAMRLWEAMAEHAEEHFPGEDLQILVVDGSDVVAIHAMTEFELKCLAGIATMDIQGVALGVGSDDDFSRAALAREVDEAEIADRIAEGVVLSKLEDVLITTHGSVDPIGLFFKPDGSASAIAIRGFLNEESQEQLYYGGNGALSKTLLTVTPIATRIEWRSHAPANSPRPKGAKRQGKDGKVSAENGWKAPTRFWEAGIRLLDNAGKALAAGQSLAMVEDEAVHLHGDVVVWFWDELAATLEDPIVKVDPVDVEYQAQNAEVRYAAGVTLERLSDLARWTMMLDFASHHERDTGYSRWEDGNTPINHMIYSGKKRAQVVEFSAAYAGRPPRLDNAHPVTERAKEILWDLLAWASPRGGALGYYAGNRQSSEQKGPAIRIVQLMEGDETGHAILEAINGLHDYLTSRGFSDAETDRLLDLGEPKSVKAA